MKKHSENYVKRLKHRIKELEKQFSDFSPIMGKTTVKKCKTCGKFYPLYSEHYRMCRGK